MIYSKKGILVRLVYLLVSLLFWLLTLQGRLFNSNRVILCYHGITDFNANAFRRQMLTVARRTVALNSQYPNAKMQFSPPSVVITFDDAFENLLHNAIPVLSELNIPASIFIVTGYMGNFPGWLKGSNHPDETYKLMSSSQIKALAENPLISLGSHTHTHQKLARIDINIAKIELEQSKNALETLIGREVYSLAFPHGSYNAKLSEIAYKSGFLKLFTLEEKMLPANQVDGEMGRFLMEPNVWPLEFRLTIDGAYSWLYYFRKLINLSTRYIQK